MRASPLTLLWTLLCVFFFKHTTAINSSSYQQCGHSKTERGTISVAGSSAFGPFSHLDEEKAIKCMSQRQQDDKKKKKDRVPVSLCLKMK